MSNWIEVTDLKNIEIDGEDINILYSNDKFGNNYIEIKKELIMDLLTAQPCEGCKHARGRHCLLSTNHCSRRGEDLFTTSPEDFTVAPKEQ